MKRNLFFLLARGAIFALVCLVTLIALIVAEENWRGTRDWQRYRKEHEARGERLDIQPLIPPAVPDDLNFAMTPLLKPLFTDSQYRGQLQKKLELPKRSGTTPSLGNWAMGKRVDLDQWRDLFNGKPISEGLSPFEPMMAEISKAVRRPYSRFPDEYEKGVAMNLPQVGIILPMAKLYTLRASNALDEGRSDTALEDAGTLFRLGESVKDEPVLISQLVRGAEFRTALQVVWEGLHEHRWSEPQLAELQSDMERIDLIEGFQRSLRGERAVFTQTLETISPRKFSEIGMPDNYGALRFVPKGVICRNLLFGNQLYEEQVFPALNPAAHTGSPKRIEQVNRDLDQYRNLWGAGIPDPGKLFVVLFIPAMGSAVETGLYAQSSIDQARIACALERYRLVHGTFPAGLEMLVPEFMKSLPHDVITGESLHYKLTGEQYQLYSGGSDGKDDSAKIVLKKNGAIDVHASDWVWNP